MLNIGTQRPQGKAFAINMAVRNAKGEATRYKYYETDDAAELHDFFQQNSVRPRNKKKAITVETPNVTA
jgi:hypothetical protein